MPKGTRSDFMFRLLFDVRKKAEENAEWVEGLSFVRRAIVREEEHKLPHSAD